MGPLGGQTTKREQGARWGHAVGHAVGVTAGIAAVPAAEYRRHSRGHCLGRCHGNIKYCASVTFGLFNYYKAISIRAATCTPKIKFSV